MSEEEQEYPQFAGPLVQWPKYSAVYRGEQFVISPVPTDDGRWLVGINDWTDSNALYPSVVAAIDGAMGVIKQTVDTRTAGDDRETLPNQDP